MNKLKVHSLFLILALVLLFFAGCHTTKKMAKSNTGVSLEGARLTEKSLSKAIEDNRLRFQTLAARLHIDYKSDKEKYNNVTAYLRMKNDSAIWISIRPVLGIEMARLLITQDSIKLRNNLKGQTETRSTKDIESVIHIPFKFEVLESLFSGNPLFTPKDITEFKADSSGIYVKTEMDPVIGNYKWSESPFLLDYSHFKLNGSSATATQTFSDYQKYDIGMFSMDRDMKVKSSSPISLHISFDKVQFNEPVEFPF